MGTRKQFAIKRRVIAFLLALGLAIAWSGWLSAGTGSAQEEPKPVAESWQWRGSLAALDDPDPEVWVLALRRSSRFDLGEVEMSREESDRVAELLTHELASVRFSAALILGGMGESAVPYIERILPLLQDEDSDVRFSAVLTLGAMGEATVPYIERILPLLQDEDSFVRSSAAQTLRGMGEAAVPYIERILPLLQHESSSVRNSAAQTLGGMGEAAVPYIERILPLLQHESSSVRNSAAQTLEGMGEAAAPYIERILPLLQHEDSDVRYNAAQTLGGMGEAVVPYIERILLLLQHEDWYVRSSAVQTLGGMGEAAVPYIERILPLLQHEDWRVRYNAVQTLGGMGEAAVPYIERILPLLQDEDSDVRDSAAQTLGGMGEAAVPYIERILPLLQHEDSGVRSSAAQILGGMGEAAVPYIERILPLLQHEDSGVRSSAAQILGGMGEAAVPYIERILPLLQDEDWRVRNSAAQILGGMGEAAVPYIERILPLLQHEDSGVRNSAVLTLGGMGEAAVPYIERILPLLQDEDSGVRSSAAQILGGMGEAAVPYIERILPLLQHEDSGVRSSAAQILGGMGEAAVPYIERILPLLQHEDSGVRSSAAQILGGMGEAAVPYIERISPLLQDEEWDVRDSAAQTLGGMGEAAVPYIEQIAILLYDRYNSPRDAAEEAIAAIATPGDIRATLPVLNITDELAASERPAPRAFAYYLSGGQLEAVTLIRWLGSPKKRPQIHSPEERRETLQIFSDAWPIAANLPNIRTDLAQQIAALTEAGKWKLQDLDLLRDLYSHLKTDYPTEARAVQAAIASIRTLQAIALTRNAFALHAIAWLLLLFAIPRACWNPWLRRYLGLFYIELVLAHIPPLRARLFAPFRDSLLADAQTRDIALDTYFPRSPVYDRATQKTLPLDEAVPTLKGQILLEGDSGLGKSMFLRHLAQRSRHRIVAYLDSDRCTQGVENAIAAKLHGIPSDRSFLRRLLYNGAIDLCIDGLNEVAPDTRAQIATFVERHPRSNILLTTQPLSDWRPPTNARIYHLQPLPESQLLDFLKTRPLPKTATREGETYDRACQDYLDKTLHNPHLSEEERQANERILSNPMDLTLVAESLAIGETPDLFRLQKQQCDRAAAAYRAKYHRDFPLAQFSEVVYTLRLSDITALPHETYSNELDSLLQQKIVVCHHTEGKSRETWEFRHDKLREYFIAQTFLEHRDRIDKHLADPRFRGVYFLLANQLELSDAEQLREKLIQYAADSKDHTLSDEFIKTLRHRQQQEDSDRRIAIYKELLELCQNPDANHSIRLRLLYQLGKTYSDRAAYERALPPLKEARQLLEHQEAIAPEDRRLLANIYYTLGRTHHKMLYHEPARLLFKDALRLFRRLGDTKSAIAVTVALGNLELQMCQFDLACQHLQEAREYYHAQNHTDRLAEIDKFLKVARETHSIK